MNLKFEDIKPVGNFDEILVTLREKADKIIAKCHEEKKYNKSIAKLITLIVGDMGLTEVLEEGIVEKDGYDMDKMLKDLLYAHLIIIDLNQVAHTYLNNITKWAPRSEQLQDYIDSKKEVFGDLKLV